MGDIVRKEEVALHYDYDKQKGVRMPNNTQRSVVVRARQVTMRSPVPWSILMNNNVLSVS